VQQNCVRRCFISDKAVVLRGRDGEREQGGSHAKVALKWFITACLERQNRVQPVASSPGQKPTKLVGAMLLRRCEAQEPFQTRLSGEQGSPQHLHIR